MSQHLATYLYNVASYPTADVKGPVQLCARCGVELTRKPWFNTGETVRFTGGPERVIALAKESPRPDERAYCEYKRR
jgi:hypothetical protein